MKLFYKNIELDSNEELYMCWWLDELKAKKFIKSFDKASKIELFKPCSMQFGDDTKHLFRELNYTPDFEIEWNTKAEKIFFIHKNQNYSKSIINSVPFIAINNKSLIDVKGTFKSKFVSTSITFPIIQKILYNVFDIYVQKIQPLGNNGLFQKTFTPKKYLLTPTGKLKKINWPINHLDHYD
jgi:hypothetical protein